MTHASDVVAARIRAGLVLLIAAIAVAGANAQQQITFFLSATSLTGEPVTDLKSEDLSIAGDTSPNSFFEPSCERAG